MGRNSGPVSAPRPEPGPEAPSPHIAAKRQFGRLDSFLERRDLFLQGGDAAQQFPHFSAASSGWRMV